MYWADKFSSETFFFFFEYSTVSDSSRLNDAASGRCSMCCTGWYEYCALPKLAANGLPSLKDFAANGYAGLTLRKVYTVGLIKVQTST